MSGYVLLFSAWIAKVRLGLFLAGMNFGQKGPDFSLLEMAISAYPAGEPDL